MAFHWPRVCPAQGFASGVGRAEASDVGRQFVQFPLGRMRLEVMMFVLSSLNET